MLNHFGSSAAVFSGSAGSNPGYGFHADYTQDQQHPGGRAPNNTGGGFWTGMGTGGLLGYMFGRQRSAQRSTWSVGDVMFCFYSFWVMDILCVLSCYRSQPFGGYSHHGYHGNTANYAPRTSTSSGTRTASGIHKLIPHIKMGTLLLPLAFFTDITQGLKLKKKNFSLELIVFSDLHYVLFFLL